MAVPVVCLQTGNASIRMATNEREAQDWFITHSYLGVEMWIIVYMMQRALKGVEGRGSRRLETNAQ